MSPSSFEPHWVQANGRSVASLYRPATIAEALALRSERPDARPVAGGTDLLLDLARGTAGPPVELIDLTAIEGFDRIEVRGGEHEILLGGGVRHNDVVADGRLVARALPLAQACLEVGSPQLRNRATIAGNLVTASPANDTISALMALGASVQLSRSVDGTVHGRSVPVSEFFDGFRSTVCAADELVTDIVVPMLGGADRGIWVKAGLRKAQAISVVHLAVTVGLDDDLGVRWARIALGSVAPTVVLASEVGAALVGRRLDPPTIAEIADMTADSIAAIDDLRAPASYRRDIVATMMQRSLTALADDRQAEMWPRNVATLSAAPAQRQAVRHQTIDDAAEIAVQLNGQPVAASGAASVTLLDWLRSNAGTGTKEGCAEGECGACTVHLDGAAVMSCLVPAAQADGSEITTIEGLAGGPALHAMQQSFVEHFAVQCGYCIPGFVMAATSLLDEFTGVDSADSRSNELPDRSEIECALAGNLCRCTGYYPIVAAVEAALAAGPTRTTI